MVFLCVPSPPREDGSCDTTIVEQTVESLSKMEYKGIVAVKSTVLPGTTETLQKRHTNLRMCFVPEFLRERCALADFVETLP